MTVTKWFENEDGEVSAHNRYPTNIEGGNGIVPQGVEDGYREDEEAAMYENELKHFSDALGMLYERMRL